MIARRSRSVLTLFKGNSKKPALPVFTNFSTSALRHQTISPEKAPTQGSGARLPLTLQSIYYQPLRRTPILGLPVCDLQLRSYLVRNLEFMCDFALRAAYYCNLPASGPVPLPKKTERWTVPKGHFVHKKSQENFERVTHKRLIQIKDGHPETVELWLAFLRKHQYHGVGMKANVWGFDELGVGKRMGVSLETLKDVPRPRWTHFGSRRSFETAEKVREILASDGYRLLAAESAQVDAALTQVTTDEAVQAKIKEILESPKYKALAEDVDLFEMVQETEKKSLEVPTEALPKEALAASGDIVPEGFEAVPEQILSEVTPKEEILTEAPEATPEAALVEAESPSAESTERTSEQPPVEAAPQDSVLTQTIVQSAEPTIPEVTPVEVEFLSTKPVEQRTSEQPPIEAAPQDLVLTQALVRPKAPTPEATPVEAEPLLTKLVEQSTLEQVPVKAAPEDSVLTQAPVQPIETATPQVAPVEAEALAFEPAEQPTLEQAPVETVSEDSALTQAPVRLIEETTPDQTLIEVTATDSVPTQPVEEASATPEQTPVKIAPEESVLADTPAEQLTPKQNPVEAAPEDLVFIQKPEPTLSQPTPEENTQVNALDEAVEAAAASPVATETKAKPTDTLEAEPVGVREQTEEVQISLESKAPVEATENGQEKKE